ncbi:MAG: SCO family protein [Vicinamibacterales bacterium]
MRWTVAGLVVAMAACAAAPEPAARRFPLTGQLIAVQLDTGQLLVKHEAIPGYMDAMTMPFTVADRAAIRDRRPGDLITATLVVEGDGSRLEDLQVTGRAPLGDAAIPPPVALGVDVLYPGDTPPDTGLTTHRGATISLADWQGSAVAVTFIYTRCPLPEYCPLLDRRFAAVQRLAADDDRLRGRVRLLSVSFDPDADTPQVLAAHAARLGAAADWHFATAPRAAVDRFAAAFGVNVIRETDGSITHNLRTAVLGPDGRLAAVHSGNDWTADDLVAELRHALEDQTDAR